jgi:hypothetical protein
VAMGRPDPARSLVALAAGLLPAARRDWGQAMLAEVDQIQGRAARWRFALGCARVALVAPRQVGGPALLLRAGLVAGAAAVGVGIYALAPAMAAVAVLFPAVLAGFVWLALLRARSAPGQQEGPGWPLRAVILGEVAGWVGVVMYAVVRYPAMGAFNLWAAVAFTGLLAGYVWMALLPPRLVTSELAAARRPALVGGLAAGGLVVAGRAVAHLGEVQVLKGSSWLALLVTPVVVGAVAARSGVADGAAAQVRADVGMRAALQAGVWSGLVGCLLLAVGGMSAVYLAPTAHVPTDAYTLHAFQASGLPDILTYEVLDNLGGLSVLLVAVPLLSAIPAAVGGALGGSLPRRTAAP